MSYKTITVIVETDDGHIMHTFTCAAKAPPAAAALALHTAFRDGLDVELQVRVLDVSISARP